MDYDSLLIAIMDKITNYKYVKNNKYTFLILSDKIIYDDYLTTGSTIDVWEELVNNDW